MATGHPKLLTRLSRIEGQVRGIARMVEEDRYCIDILNQMQAIKAALKKSKKKSSRATHRTASHTPSRAETSKTKPKNSRSWLNFLAVMENKPVRDPVCGMMVDPAAAKFRADEGGVRYYFCSAGVPVQVYRQSHGLRQAGACAKARGCRRHLYLPHASANPPDGSRKLPDLRHDAGAPDGNDGDRSQSRTDRYVPEILDRIGSDLTGVRAGDGQPHTGAQRKPHYLGYHINLDTIRSQHAGRLVGRLAVFSRAAGRLCKIAR